ncbi:MAG: Trk system potassium uptake protein TrkA, partial [uncultured Solirubrobacteraceae bacterium]
VRRRRGRGTGRLGGRALRPRRRPRGLRARRGPALPRAPRRRAVHLVGRRGRPLHRRHRDRDRGAGRGGPRRGRSLHRLDRRGQHEPRHRADRPGALQRPAGHHPGDGPGAGDLVRRAGTRDDLPDQGRHRDVQGSSRLDGGPL